MTQIIPTPLSAWERLGGPMLVISASGLVSSGPFSLAPALAMGLLICCVGGALWWRYLQQRPTEIHLTGQGSILCRRSDGAVFETRDVLTGVINPGIVTARLTSDTGKKLDLIVLRSTTGAQAHWALRRALLAFRPDRGPATTP